MFHLYLPSVYSDLPRLPEPNRLPMPKCLETRPPAPVVVREEAVVVADAAEEEDVEAVVVADAAAEVISGRHKRRDIRERAATRSRTYRQFALQLAEERRH